MEGSNRTAKAITLAEEAAGLREVPYDSPKVGLWKTKARAFVESEFGDDYLRILNRALFFKRVVTNVQQGQQQHREGMDKAIEFLTELEAEEPSEPRTEDEAAASGFLRLGDLHPAILEGCSDLYNAGHLAEAVEKSFRIVRDRLRALTGYETGSDAFGRGRLRIGGAIAHWVEDDFNEAVKFVTMAIDRFRNEKVHTADARIAEPIRAAEYLAMSSLAMRLLDGAYIAPDA